MCHFVLKHLSLNLINYPIDRTLEMMTYTLTKCGKVCNGITHNSVWSTQKTECFLYRWLHVGTRVMFDIMCCPAICRSIRHPFKPYVDRLIGIAVDKYIHVCKYFLLYLCVENANVIM